MKQLTGFKQLVVVGLGVFLLTATSASLVFAQDNNTESSSNDEATETQMEETNTSSELQQALETAVDRFKDEFPDADITEVDIDLEANNNYEIQIEGYDGTNEVELEYHTETEEIREIKTDDDDGDSNRPLPMDELLSIDEVNEITLAEAGFGEITDWHLEHDDDRDNFVWDIEISDAQSNQEAELEIDALSGEVLDIEFDD